MEFKTLIELAQTVTRNKIKNIEVLGNQDQKGSLVESFYDALTKGAITSDETAVRYLYGHDDKKDPAYQRLKGRLVKQLHTTALFVDVNQPSFNERSKAYYACYRDYSSAFVLLLRGAHKAAVNLLEQILEHSIKYEFIELAADITRHLRTYTARGASGQKQHQYYVAIHRTYEEKRRLEMLALDYHEELVDYYINHRSPNREIKRMAEIYVNELKLLAAKADTSRFYFYLYQIEAIKYFADNNCKAVIQLVDTALNFLESRKNTNRSMLHTIALQKLACITQLRTFEGEVGDKTVEYCLLHGIEGEVGWYRALESYFYYLSYTQKYSKALQIFKKVITHVQFATLEGSFRDNLLLLGGYIHLLAALGKLDPKEVEEIAGPYRYGRLINEIKVVDKDREGMNIPLLLLPILYNLANGNTQDHGRSREALEKYRQRYLDNEINQRSAVFVNMLLALDKKMDNPVDAEKRIKKGLVALSQEQPQVVGQNFAIEIIPYEDLWAMLMEKMERKG